MKRREFVCHASGLAGTVMVGGWLPFRSQAELRAPALDAHAHVNSVEVADLVEELIGSRVIESIGGTELIRRMDATGVSRALVHSTAYMWATDAFEDRKMAEAEEHRLVRKENDFAAAESAEHPDRLIPFLSLNPKRGYPVEEIDRCVDELGMRGLKLHFWNSIVDLRQADQLEHVRTVLVHAANRGLPILVHAFNGGIEDYGPSDTELLVREIILPHDNLRLCFAHLGGAGGFGSRIQEVLARLVEILGPGSPASERVFIDMAAVLFSEDTERIPATPEADRKRMGELLEGWGVERVFWGSDNIQDYLKHVQDAWPLTEEEWEVVSKHTGAAFLGAR